MKANITKVAIAILCLVFNSLVMSGKPIDKNADHQVNNIILFIGDGIGVAQWQAGMIYSPTPLNIENMKSLGLVNTYSLDHFNGDGPSHGTAIATGSKTNNGLAGIDPNGRPIKPITKFASENGFSTGIVSANTLMEGSIVPFVAQVKNRMQKEDIAASYIDNRIDVFIGSGLKYFQERKDKRDLLTELKKQDYQVAKSFIEMQDMHKEKLAGFIEDNIHPDSCQKRQTNLSNYVHIALNHLKRNPKGFFLVVEDMLVDRASHAEDLQSVGMEIIAFDQAIGEALKFASTNGNTLVIVVGGPEASGMTLVGGNIKSNEVEAKWTMPGMIHTCTMVPIYAFGKGAEHFQGFMNNTFIFHKTKELLLNKK